MWGRRKRDRHTAQVADRATSYWSTDPDPAAHHVYETTQDANPEQQKQIMELMLLRQSGTISDPDFTARLTEIMNTG